MKFPMDCPRECKYFKSFDLSIDDYTNICYKLNKQVDDYDAYGPFYLPFFCPLSEQELREACK